MSYPYGQSYYETPMASTSPPALEAQHQREMIRIHEMWQKTKSELAMAQMELQRRDGYVSAGGEKDKAMQQLQSLTVELRDKCRFTELQLAGAREENGKLAASCQELRQSLSDAQGQLAGLQAHTQQQSPVISELQAMLERVHHEKQALVEQLHQEQRRLEQAVSNKEFTMHLQEQKLASTAEELRRSIDAHTSSSAAVESAHARIAELERSSGELGRQLLGAKEQVKYLHLNRRSEAQVQALLHQLQLDNARLVKLLSSTEEYKVRAVNVNIRLPRATGGRRRAIPVNVNIRPSHARSTPVPRPPCSRAPRSLWPTPKTVAASRTCPRPTTCRRRPRCATPSLRPKPVCSILKRSDRCAARGLRWSIGCPRTRTRSPTTSDGSTWRRCRWRSSQSCCSASIGCGVLARRNGSSANRCVDCH